MKTKYYLLQIAKQPPINDEQQLEKIGPHQINEMNVQKNVCVQTFIQKTITNPFKSHEL